MLIFRKPAGILQIFKMKTLLIVYFLFIFNFTHVNLLETGPPGPIKIHEINECSDSLNTIGLKATVDTASDKTDSFSLSFTLPEYKEGDLSVSVTAEKFANGGWNHCYDTENQLLVPFANTFATEVWSRLRAQMQPPIKDTTKLPAGTYKLEKFKATHGELNAPQVFYGRYQAEVYFAVDEEDLVCVKVELEFFEPSASSMMG